MDYAKHASDVGLQDRICTVCRGEVGAAQPIAYDIHDTQTATVRCWGCHLAVLEAKAHVCLELMNVFQYLGDSTAAAVVFGHLQKLDDALTQAKAA